MRIAVTGATLPANGRPGPPRMSTSTVDDLIHGLPSELKGEVWLDSDAIGSVAYSKFWNDEDIERQKPWHVIANGFEKMDEYVASMGFVEDLTACVGRLRARGKFVGGTGIDVAAGVLWLLPLLFRIIKPDHVTCLEYSAHRLLKLGPEVLKRNGVPLAKVTLALGSFYDIKAPAGSMDFAVLCQAFHHADHPDQLIEQIAKVLKPDGVIIILGEDAVDWAFKHDLLHAIRYVAYRFLPAAFRRSFLHSPYGAPRSLIARSQDIFPPDPVLGDHAYIRREYGRIFAAHGFRAEFVDRPGARTLSLVAYRR
jgi:SAM-dependent methyltransferase